MNVFTKHYDRTRAAWIYSTGRYFRCRETRLLKHAIQRVQPAFDDRGQIRTHGRPDQIKRLDHYLALAGWVEKQKVEQCYQELGGQ